MLSVPALQMDIAYACNLHCRGCTHYSNYGIKGVVPLEQGGEWLRTWARRLRPSQFDIAGGEPLINPEVCGYIRLAAELWPEAKRVLFTNGYLLDRREDLFETVAETGTGIVVSLHSTNPQDLEKLMPQINKLDAARATLGFEAQVTDGTLFYSTYRGEGKDMRPSDDGDPEGSWRVCCNKDCKTIHRGRIWKCPPLAYLDLVEERFALGTVPEWAPYLAYEGIGPEVSDQELLEFFNGKAESVCGMCPNRLVQHPAL